ncbi:RNA polymerase-binding protein RbpA [Curtobacterium sp. MCBD17_032]|uniref:RNA polymerase-binding protein RbpA n=1 Tax=Curtobacterium sp. MCBD17_032 TaxID=2175659 RepID=UPI000DA7AA53|nr:RNA polymerase-binding protein RbpA [Curtobacterium sp. MCBD17_032]PZE84316.1 RNA polymerase-binding protein RbpA [Curtobacterium sp. MCBD17_032]
MADRSLRGMRLGSQSLQSEDGVELSERKRAVYQAVSGETFDVVFSAEAEVPAIWSDPRTGMEGRLLGEDGTPVEVAAEDVKAPRTHWDMLLERRSREELEELLQERLQVLRARRGA